MKMYNYGMEHEKTNDESEELRRNIYDFMFCIHSFLQA